MRIWQKSRLFQGYNAHVHACNIACTAPLKKKPEYAPDEKGPFSIFLWTILIISHANQTHSKLLQSQDLNSITWRIVCVSEGSHEVGRKRARMQTTAAKQAIKFGDDNSKIKQIAHQVTKANSMVWLPMNYILRRIISLITENMAMLKKALCSS